MKGTGTMAEIMFLVNYGKGTESQVKIVQKGVLMRDLQASEKQTRRKKDC
jgi:hypothetical protein